MTITIITHVPHSVDNKSLFAYGPYVREMNLWTKYVDDVIVVSPFEQREISPIDEKYTFANIQSIRVQAFNVLNFKSAFIALFRLPLILISIFNAMRAADHIHLRCPGNIGLLGCLVQVLFPRKPKTAKYAGNWDPQSVQPLSYRFQKWILNNTFLTRNMQVLVYGDWPAMSKNIKPFFTASYSEVDKVPVQRRLLSQPLQFLFVGTLSEGKQPLYAVKLVEHLIMNGHNASLKIFGDGTMRTKLEEYLSVNRLENNITLMGNRDSQTVRNYYKKSHFLILPSKSEGWPKVVAEAMFWGCLPVSLHVSCVPCMLDNGVRGILLSNELDSDVAKLELLIGDQNRYDEMVTAAMGWSREFTVEKFEDEIRKLL